MGDGSSSNSESSLGSSSGYGSQNTVKVDEINQQLQKQKQNISDGQNNQPGITQNNSQRSNDGKRDYKTCQLNLSLNKHFISQKKS